MLRKEQLGRLAASQALLEVRPPSRAATGTPGPVAGNAVCSGSGLDNSASLTAPSGCCEMKLLLWQVPAGEDAGSLSGVPALLSAAPHCARVQRSGAMPHHVSVLIWKESDFWIPKGSWRPQTSCSAAPPRAPAQTPHVSHTLLQAAPPLPEPQLL